MSTFGTLMCVIIVIKSILIIQICSQLSHHQSMPGNLSPIVSPPHNMCKLLSAFFGTSPECKVTCRHINNSFRLLSNFPFKCDFLHIFYPLLTVSHCLTVFEATKSIGNFLRLLLNSPFDFQDITPPCQN